MRPVDLVVDATAAFILDHIPFGQARILDVGCGEDLIASRLGETSTAYLYRYLCPVLAENEDGYAIAPEVLELEKRMAQLGAIKWIGRRFVGVKV